MTKQMTEVEADQKMREFEGRLRPKLTAEFLKLLDVALSVYACRVFVHRNEPASFVRWCHDVAGVERPDSADHDDTGESE